MHQCINRIKVKKNLDSHRSRASREKGDDRANLLRGLFSLLRLLFLGLMLQLRQPLPLHFLRAATSTFNRQKEHNQTQRTKLRKRYRKIQHTAPKKPPRQVPPRNAVRGSFSHAHASNIRGGNEQAERGREKSKIERRRRRDPRPECRRSRRRVPLR